MKALSIDLAEIIADHDAVLSTSAVLTFLTEGQLRWKISSGRWQQPARGVVVAQLGPLTSRQALRAAQLRAGPQSALAGLTAAELDGLKGCDDKDSLAERPIHVLIPYGYKRRSPPLGLNVIPTIHNCSPVQTCTRCVSRDGRGSRGP
jgi:hypothetical protein